jgi:XTP/dITP diphosphohydrolase
MKTVQENFLRLIKIMDELREKCPWDKKQTIQTLRSMTIEETYELADAILNEDWQNMQEELGDILLHIIFYSKIAAEQQQFQLNDVLESICKKLVVRHPHIYGNVQATTEEEVKRNWEKIKIQEGKKSALDGVPAALPAIVKAIRIQEKAKQVGFEWSNKEDVWKKVEEETAELKHEIALQDAAKTEEEFGDLLFSLINYARFLQIDAEAALEKTNKKFIQRFKAMESTAGKLNKELSKMSLAEMDEIWESVKKENHSS